MFHHQKHITCSINKHILFAPSIKTSSSTIRGSRYIRDYGEIRAYNYNWNSTGMALNEFWSGNIAYEGSSYLNPALNLVNTCSYNCICRVLVNAGGGAGIIIIATPEA